MSEDPRTLIAHAPMHYRQIVAIAVLTACVAVEGFDVYSISFAAPGIAQAWGINRAVLGVALSMDLVGMGIGSAALGWLADRIGRRPIIIVCMSAMVMGMWLASLATDIVTLSAIRLATGLGIGGLLATASALVVELSNERNRSLAVSLMIGGFAFGAVLGGTVAAALLAQTGRWQTIFEAGALMTAALIPLVLLLIPESIDFLCQRQPEGALARLNHLLAQQGRAPLAVLPARAAPHERAGAIFEPGVRTRTVTLTLAFSLYMVALYFLLKWIPKLVADMGYASAEAGLVLIWANVGGIAGTVVISLLTRVADMRYLVVGALACAAASVAVFGSSTGQFAGLAIAATTAGFFLIGANSGFYSIVAQSFPSHLRASGTGFVIGVGRAGSAAGPILAGLLLDAGWPLALVAAVMASSCAASALIVARFGRAGG